MTCSMECRSISETLLRANAALCVLAPAVRGLRGAHRRSIHFAPGPSSPDEDDVRDRAPPPRRWYRAAYARLLRHAGSLAGVDHAGGLPRHGATGSLVACPHAAARAAHFDALAGEFVAAVAAASRGHPPPKMEATSLSSLTQVCDVLGVTAQRRKSVRLTVCPQVTQHHVWRGALEAVLGDLQADMASLDTPSPATQMAEQIASACLPVGDSDVLVAVLECRRSRHAMSSSARRFRSRPPPPPIQRLDLLGIRTLSAFLLRSPDGGGSSQVDNHGTLFMSLGLAAAVLASSMPSLSWRWTSSDVSTESRRRLRVVMTSWCLILLLP